MKLVSSIFLTALICSCNSQKSTAPAKSDTTVTKASANQTKSATPTKSVILNNPPEKVNETKSSTPTKTAVLNNSASVSAPQCILNLIKAFKEEDVQNPPRKMYSYSYKGSTVYYVTPPCCDFFSDLYDSNCKLIAHPDGGITGKGDGRLKDFVEMRSNEKIVWEDARKYR
ncbi:MAG: hypothetical protein ABIP80_04365 [Ferruginibacter sp.]